MSLSRHSVLRSLFFLLGLALVAAPAHADWLVGEYDPRTHVGRLMAESPDGRPVEVTRKEGRYPAEQVEVRHQGRPGRLVLWKGSARDPSVFPELWMIGEDGMLRRTWPADPNFSWVEAEVQFTERQDEPKGEFLEVRRSLPSAYPGVPDAWTRERLALRADGLELVEKYAETWESERQLLLLAKDSLLAGRPEGIHELVEAHEGRGLPLSTGTRRRLLAMAWKHAEGLGAEPEPWADYDELIRGL